MPLRFAILSALALLLGVGCNTAQQVPSTRAFPLTDRPDITQALASHYASDQRGDGLDPVRLQRIELYRFSARDNLFAAICDWETQWWGDFIVFDFRDGKINWIATVDSPPTEQSILAIKPVLLPGFAGPLLEVYGTTHMGNGNFYLYHLNIEKRRLELVLQTFAVDRHQDGTLIRGGRLTPVYYMPTQFRRKGNIVLVGIVDHYPANVPINDPGPPTRSFRANKLFIFDEAKGRYVGQTDQWMGVGPYEGRD